MPARYWSSFWRFPPVAFAIHLAVDHFCGLYDQMWRCASVQEARRTVQAGTIGGGAVIVASMAMALLGSGLRTPPLSVVAFGAVLTMLGSGAVRFQSRLLASGRGPADGEWSRVLIVGAGDAGSMLLKDLLHTQSTVMQPVGLVDDDRRQIAADGPVTVTDPKMTRYFMSVQDAVQLVLQEEVIPSAHPFIVVSMKALAAASMRHLPSQAHNSATVAP